MLYLSRPLLAYPQLSMTEFSIPTLFGLLLILLLLSAFFSGCETAMLVVNRIRLRHKANEGVRGARLALEMLEKSEKLMGLILLANTLLNAAAVTLSGLIVVALLGHTRWAPEISTLAIAFLLLIFTENSPKLICAAYADKIVPVISPILSPLVRLASPFLWFIRLFVNLLLRALHLSPRHPDKRPALNSAELRTLVLESASFIPSKHRSILTNLFELENITVEDLMTPRNAVEILDLSKDWHDVHSQLVTSHHGRLPVCRESLDQLLGVLQVRRGLAEIQHGEFNEAQLIASLQEPYYIPAKTEALAQLTFFQERRQDFGFVIDEYGEILGLLTLEDIIEEIVGQFASSGLDSIAALYWDSDDCAYVDGSRSLREINRLLGLNFPVDGPKTLNGLILEHFQDIPEPGVNFKISGIQIEILHTLDRSVRTAKLFRP